MKLVCMLFSVTTLLGVVGNAAEWPEVGVRLKLDTDESKTTIEQNKIGLSEKELRTELRKAFHGYFVVPKGEWTNRYSHVGGMDASGVIEWLVPNPPIKWRWLFRPGGLATLTRTDGTVIYLAREKQQIESIPGD